MSKKGENIYKRKDGRWEGRYIKCYDESGRAKYGYVYARTYNEVKSKVLQKRRDDTSAPDVGSSILYSDLLDLWLQSARINIKESTYARYTHLIESHIRPYLGKYPLSKISTQLVEGYVERQLNHGRLDNGGSLSPKTVIDILFIVKSTIEYAKYSNMKVICNLRKLTIKKKEREMRVLNHSEQDALVAVLVNDIDLYKLGVLLSLYTGIRVGELCALQWEDISIQTSTLKVRKTMQRIQETNVGSASKTKVVITEPKSQCSIRDIPIPKFLLQYLTMFYANPKAYVLSGDKSKYIEPRVMQNRFQTYVSDSGIAKANYHALRHTFATRCVEVGFEIKSLSEILGHANVNITLNRYVHSSFALKADNMNKLTFRP